MKNAHRQPDRIQNPFKSLVDQDWSPHGQVYFLTKKGGLMSLTFWTKSQMFEVQKYAEQEGLRPLHLGNILQKLVENLGLVQKLDFFRTDDPQQRPDMCPVCWTGEFLKLDQKGRGWYCSQKISKDEYCGWQNWSS